MEEYTVKISWQSARGGDQLTATGPATEILAVIDLMLRTHINEHPIVDLGKRDWYAND